jgi:hypothetical protein
MHVPVPYCRGFERELFQGRLLHIVAVKDNNEIEGLSSHPLPGSSNLLYAIPTPHTTIHPSV